MGILSVGGFVSCKDFKNLMWLHGWAGGFTRLPSSVSLYSNPTACSITAGAQ